MLFFQIEWHFYFFFSILYFHFGTQNASETIRSVSNVNDDRIYFFSPLFTVAPFVYILADIVPTDTHSILNVLKYCFNQHSAQQTLTHREKSHIPTQTQSIYSNKMIDVSNFSLYHIIYLLHHSLTYFTCFRI